MADMTAYPIIFSAPMVLALLAGRKTQTRRLAWQECRDTKQALRDDAVTQLFRDADGFLTGRRFLPSIWQKRHDKFQDGERPWLWVKEAHWGCDFAETGEQPIVVYEERHHGGFYDHPGNIMVCANKFGHIPSIHMPKRASRLSLRVTDMQMEHIQSVTWNDAVAEGVEYERGYQDPRECFARLWDSIHGPGAWAKNPEVVATTFEIHRQNIGAVHG